MEKTNDGGPAFPSIQENIIIPHELAAKYPEIVRELQHMKLQKGGMTLRQYYAGQALNGMCSVTGIDFGGPEGAAKTALKLADALIKELEKGKR
jgi:hypothetical protein